MVSSSRSYPHSLTPTPMIGGVKMTISQTYVKQFLSHYAQSYPHPFKQHNMLSLNWLKLILKKVWIRLASC